MNQLSFLFISVGLMLVLTGLLWSGSLGPLGRLPGDIRISRPTFTFYFPLMTSLLISLALSVFIWGIQKFWR